MARDSHCQELSGPGGMTAEGQIVQPSQNAPLRIPAVLTVPSALACFSGYSISNPRNEALGESLPRETKIYESPQLGLELLLVI